ncbi:MAG: hypothetical protein ACK4S3_05820 [Parvibaculum sp.]
MANVDVSHLVVLMMMRGVSLASARIATRFSLGPLGLSQGGTGLTES